VDPNLKRKLIVGSISAVIVAISLVVAFFVKRQRRKMMQKLADELGLEITGGNRMYPKVALLWWMKRPVLVMGKVRGHFVAFQHIQSGRNTYHGFSMALRTDSRIRTTVQTCGLKSAIAITPGKKKVDTGDALFDSKIAIRSTNPVLSAVIFSTPEIRGALLETWKKEKPSAKIEIEKGVVRYICSGGLSSEKKVRHMAAMIHTASVLANALDAAADVTRSKT
jgi:hypothetical protein